VSPGKKRAKRKALKGRNRLFCPFRACTVMVSHPRAHALGFPVLPFQGSWTEREKCGLEMIRKFDRDEFRAAETILETIRNRRIEDGLAGDTVRRYGRAELPGRLQR
jgi:hypothetical protein